MLTTSDDGGVETGETDDGGVETGETVTDELTVSGAQTRDGGRDDNDDNDDNEGNGADDDSDGQLHADTGLNTHDSNSGYNPNPYLENLENREIQKSQFGKSKRVESRKPCLADRLGKRPSHAPAPAAGDGVTYIGKLVWSASTASGSVAILYYSLVQKQFRTNTVLSYTTA